jgi:hypothetical protein
MIVQDGHSGRVRGFDILAESAESPTSVADGSPSRARVWSAWAAIESIKRIPKASPVGVLRERVADRRGPNIGDVAAARRQLELVFYALRDGQVRALEHLPATAA